MLKVFIGIDKRQPIAYHVLASSIMRRSSKPVALIPLIIDQLPIKRRGLTDFTFARYLVPYLCDFKGKAVFIDSDMLLNADILELFDLDGGHAVSVVPFDGQLTFERPSVMLFNCDQCEKLTPDYIDDESNHPQSLEWVDSIGALPQEWNHLVGYSEPQDAKLIHYTQGVPGFKECRYCEYADLWFEELKVVKSHCSWIEIMGSSVHAPHVLEALRAY